MAKNKLAKNITQVIIDEKRKAVMEDRKHFGAIATKLITAIVLIVLHDNFGFGAKRLQRVQSLIEEQMDCLLGDYVSVDDLEQLADELMKKVNLESK